MKLGWIGTGLMGEPMATRLLDAGHDVVVTTRRPESARRLLGAGAEWAADPGACAAGMDAVFLMLPDPQTVLAAAEDVIEGLPSGAVVVDMSTSGTATAEALASAASARGAEALDAPVSGGPAGARTGSLAIMVGGASEAFDRVRPALDAMGSPVRFGPTGAGQRAKLVNQVLIAGTMAGVAEAFTLAQSNGLATDEFLEMARGGMAGSALLDFAWPRLMADDLAPGFKVSHFIKDLSLVVDEAARADHQLPITALVRELYQEAAENLGADVGTQALAAQIQGTQRQQEELEKL